MIQWNCFRFFGFFKYRRGVRWLVLFGKQQKYGSSVREDDVEDDHSTSKAITVLRNRSEQGSGVGNKSSVVAMNATRWDNEGAKKKSQFF